MAKATVKGNLKRHLRHLKDDVRRAARSAGSAKARNVNFAGRANVVVADNVDADNSSHASSAKQTVRIRQRGHDREERSETIRVDLEEDARQRAGQNQPSREE